MLLTSVAATFIAFATEGLMVHNTPAQLRGRAAGWFQSGNQFGQTAGGGIGLWLMNHSPSPWMAGAALSAIIGACALATYRLEEPPRELTDASVRDRAADAWRKLLEVIRSRAGRLGLILAILPIGTGASQYLFGSIGPEWNAPADMVSLVLGLGGGIAIVAGCFAGGRLADRMDKPTSYAISCGLGLVACVGIALSPRTAVGYAASTLFYTFTLGMVAASFTGLVLAVIGHPPRPRRSICSSRSTRCSASACCGWPAGRTTRGRRPACSTPRRCSASARSSFSRSWLGRCAARCRRPRKRQPSMPQ